MGTGFLQRLSVLISNPPKQVAPIDVAPPPALLGGLALGVLIALCLLVLVIVVVAFFVIRAVKKNHAAKEVPPARDNPTASNP